MINVFLKKNKIKMTNKRYLLLGLFVISLIATLYRYHIGLSITNLSNRYPWGLWIAVDLIGTALACVGFNMTLLSKIFHKNEYLYFTKRSILMTLLFYIFISMILIVEIGRWDNFWRPFVSPGISSPMFIVVLCVVIYSFLLVLEVCEVIGEKVEYRNFKVLKMIMPIVAILACSIPPVYQASLGSIYLSMDGKLNELWSTPLMPLFFLISSFLAGFGVIILESLVIEYSTLNEYNLLLLQKLSKIGVITSVIYLTVKMIDVIVRLKDIDLLSFESLFFLLELFFLSALPIGIYFLNLGKTKNGLFVYSISIIIGLVLNRINIIFIGMNKYLGGGYFPSFIEIIITIGFFSFVSLIYVLIIEKFKFFDK